MAKSKKSANEKYKAPFATAIRSLMEGNGTTQDDLADKIGKTRQTVSQYVNGISEPGYDTLVKIADHFDVSTDFLLGRTRDKSRAPSAIDQLGISESVSKWLQSIAMEPTNDSNFTSNANHILENTTFQGLVRGLRVYEEALKAKKIYYYLLQKTRSDDYDQRRKLQWSEIEKIVNSNVCSKTICSCLIGEFYVADPHLVSKIDNITATILHDGIVSDFSEIYASQISREFTQFLCSLEEEVEYTSIENIMSSYVESAEKVSDSE